MVPLLVLFLLMFWNYWALVSSTTWLSVCWCMLVPTWMLGNPSLLAVPHAGKCPKPTLAASTMSSPLVPHQLLVSSLCCQCTTWRAKVRTKSCLRTLREPWVVFRTSHRRVYCWLTLFAIFPLVGFCTSMMYTALLYFCCWSGKRDQLHCAVQTHNTSFFIYPANFYPLQGDLNIPGDTRLLSCQAMKFTPRLKLIKETDHT